METNKHPFRSFIISLITLVSIGYGAYWAIAKLLAQLASVTSDLGKAIVAAGATITVATVSVVFGKIWEQRVKLQEEVRQRKLPVYEAHIEFMFKRLFASKEEGSGAGEPSAEVIAAFRAFSAQIIVWGGAEVIKTWTAFRLHSWEDDKSLSGFKKFEAFVKAVRIELGNKNTSLAEGDLLKLFVNDYDAYKAKLITGAPPE